MAATTGLYYWGLAGQNTIMLCTDGASFEFQRFPDGQVMKFGADPTGGLTGLLSCALNVPGSQPLWGRPLAECKVDGADYEILDAYSSNSLLSGLGQMSAVLVRPSGEGVSAETDRKAAIVVPFPLIYDVLPVDLLPPFVASVAPNRGSHLGGTPVVIIGRGFSTANLLSGSVAFGAVPVDPAKVVIVSDREIHCKSPPHVIGANHVTVTNSSGLTSPFVAGDVFTYV
jgi:IPT/TIG domain